MNRSTWRKKNTKYKHFAKIKEDKKYIFDANVNFRWGAVAHISEENYEFANALNKTVDILDQKIKKEKDKIQEKK